MARMSKRTKRDGTVLRSKKEMTDDYDQSAVPYPLKPMLHLDYCWRLNYLMFKHSLYLSAPLSAIYFAWRRMPGCFSYTIRSFPYRAYIFNYWVVLLTLTAVNSVWALAFDDYCDRHSSVYTRNVREVKHLMKEENARHKKTVAGQTHKALNENEL